MKVDGERTRGESERESEREREREIERARKREREIERERQREREEDRGREREREKTLFETYKELFCIRKSKKQLFLRLAKATDSYFGDTEATLFETVFETQQQVETKPTKCDFQVVLRGKKSCF